MEYNFAIIGSAGVGKTTFIKRHLTGEFTQQYNPTIGWNINDLTFSTTQGNIKVHIYDHPGNSQQDHAHIYSKMDAAIFMFDVTSKQSYKKIGRYIKAFKESAGDEVPYLIIGNKVGNEDRKIKPMDITIHKSSCVNCQYYDVSAKANYNYDKPFLQLFRLLNDNSLRFTEADAYSIIVPHNSPREVRPKSYKICVIGNGGSGKTAFIKKLRTGEFERKYLYTIGVEVTTLKYNTNHGEIALHVWDCAGQVKFMGLYDGYWIGAHGYILLADNQQSMKHYIGELNRFMGSDRKPVRIYYGKDDEGKLGPFGLSSKTDYNLYKPIQDILSDIVGKEVNVFA